MRIYGLIDGNSFYSSCETAFDPALIGLPVVVLSNNDGCAIARNTPAKKLGVKMGDPFHLVRNKHEMQGVRWFSSDFALYGDISRRVYQVIAARVPRAEPYSIDETFLDLAELPGSLYERCRQLRADVLRIAKIPTCIGWGYTKTIAFYRVALSSCFARHFLVSIHVSLTYGLARSVAFTPSILPSCCAARGRLRPGPPRSRAAAPRPARWACAAPARIAARRPR